MACLAERWMKHSPYYSTMAGKWSSDLLHSITMSDEFHALIPVAIEVNEVNNVGLG